MAVPGPSAGTPTRRRAALVALPLCLLLPLACAEPEVEADYGGRDDGGTDRADAVDTVDTVEAVDEASETVPDVADVEDDAGDEDGAVEDVPVEDVTETPDVAPGTPTLVISEIDYDQPGGDSTEFLELYNFGSAPAPCSGIQIRFINGSIGAPYALHFLACTSIPVGGYHIVGDDIVVGSVTCPGDIMTADRIENGPDVLQLVHVAGSTTTMLDQVAYGDAVPGYGEGSPAPADPDTDPEASIQRRPPGHDTDDNGADFHVLPRTPCGPPG